MAPPETEIKTEKKGKIDGKNLRRGAQKYDILRAQTRHDQAKDVIKKTEMLLPETSGQLERENGSTAFITQNAIKAAVDITAATKCFDLNLNQFGPYKFRYSVDGRQIVLGGRMGHLATFDWVTKRLKFELNVTQSIHDVCFLHDHEMVAVAQKTWTYIYDKKGVELHCLREMNDAITLEFLQYHFLLCSGSEMGYLRWLDVTMGKEVLKTPTYKGRLNIMCQNPANAVLYCGHGKGVVSMWTPNTKQAVAELFCHPQPVTALAIEPYGRLMATASLDRTIKIWDNRKMGESLAVHRVRTSPYNLSFSQKGLLAATLKDRVEVYKNISDSNNAEIYMRHPVKSVHKLEFCPYEDVLGISGYEGFSSLIIPGSGEPNFDALEVNPYSGKQARREGEVKAVLGKLHHSIITLDPKTLLEVDVATAKEKVEATLKENYVNVPKLDFQPRFRMKGKSGSTGRFKRKNIEQQRHVTKFVKEKKLHESLSDSKVVIDSSKNILDRFKSKKKVNNNSKK